MRLAENILKGLREGWQTNAFASAEVAAYAKRTAIKDARAGLMISSGILLCLFLMDTVLFNRFGYAAETNYTLLLLSALAVHIFISARVINDVASVYSLGTTMLIVTGTAFVLLANSLGTFSFALFASVTLLFVVVPIVPWGLREASIVLGLIYLMFTGATWTTRTNFDSQTIWSLQFIMLGTGLISLALVWRNTLVRKADIRARYELEVAHREMLNLSNKDPLTGAWNRRYLADHFAEQLARWGRQGRICQVAFIDIDDFKQINDGHGHDVGDRVLRCLTDTFTELFQDEDIWVRMGGDEFAILFSSETPEQEVRAGVERLNQRIGEQRHTLEQIGLSIGLMSLPPVTELSQQQVYQRADAALYEAKKRKPYLSGEPNIVHHNLAGGA